MDTVKITIRIPKEIHDKIVALAQKEHRSLNSQIVKALDDATQENDTPASSQNKRG